MDTLTDAQARAKLAGLGGWTLEGTAIRRQYVFPGFPDAVTFVVRLAFEAESADHHPDLLINYKRVTVTYTTHSSGGLTNRDFEGARQAERFAAEMRGA